MALYSPTEIAEGYTMEDVDEKYILSDGTRNLDIYYVQGLPHVEGMLMAFLPKEKIIIEADLLRPCWFELSDRDRSQCRPQGFL